MFFLFRRRRLRGLWLWAALLAVALAASAGTAADPPKTYYLNKDGSVEARVEQVAAKVDTLQETVDALRKRVAFLEGASAPAAAPAKTASSVASSPPRAAAGHTHTCSRGHTWDHTMDGGSHRCPACGESQFVQDPGPPSATARPAAPVLLFSGVSSTGCGPAGCPASFTPARRTLFRR